uniref:BclA protein n=1 Tax=Siphoviridae sp. ctxMM9 TaxID=2827973 RepID=A0A8S5T667_9CAUD|nr:MAG TPA: BclA protein [Siphoviridae sp. ctxMM9]
MLYTYSSTEQTVNANGAILLTTNGIDCRCDGITHSGGSSTITITKPGNYIIDVNCVATSATTGDLSFQLYNNGVAIPGAIATNNIATASNKANYAFTAAIRVLASCPVINNTAQLTIQNISANAATVTNAAVTIKAA